MSKWDDEYAGHPLWTSVDQLRGRLDECPRTEDPAERDQVDRLRRLVIELDARRDVESVLVSRPVLDTLHQAINNIDAQVVNYINQPGSWPSYLTPAATTYADQVLLSLMQLPQPAKGPAAAAARAAARAYRDAAEGFMQAVQDSAEKAIAAIEEDRENSASATQAALAEVNSLRTAVAKSEARMTEQVTRLETSLTTHQGAFETQQSERADRFQKDLETFRHKLDQQLANAQEAAARQTQEEHEEAQQTLAELDRLHEQAKAVVEATGRRVVTTEFGEYAAKQDRAAFWWSITAIALALCGFGFIAIQIATLHGSDVSWELAAYKITASVALLLVAGFAGKQSAGHREQEKQAKRRQLEINALEPFLSRLPDEQAEALRAKMADRILVQPPAESGETAAVGLPTGMDLGSILGAALREFAAKKDG